MSILTHYGVPRVNCREAVDLMGEHVDGELGVWTRGRLRLHLWICRVCRQYLSSYRATIRMAKSKREGDDVAAESHVPDALVESILDAARHA